MYKLCAVIVACLLCSTAQGKRNKNGWIKPEDEEKAPKPDVVSYSTFGVNDVGTYEGFVPSSPDFTKFLTGGNEESTTNQQPPSFPTSVDSTAYGNPGQGNYETPPSASDHANPPSSFSQYQQNYQGFFNSPFDQNVAQPKNNANEIYETNKDESNRPIYGTKLGNRNRLRFGSNFNHTEFEISSDKNEAKYKLNEALPTFENKPAQSELGNGFPKFSAYPSSVADLDKVPEDAHNPFKFQRVVDFTKMKYHPELDTSLMPGATPRPDNYENPGSASGSVMYTNVFSDSQHNTPFAMKEVYDKKSNNNENTAPTAISSNRNNYNTDTDDKLDYGWYDVKPSHDSKKKIKHKPWATASNNFQKWKEPTPSNGYEYSTNVSSMSFKYGVNEPKKPFISGHDELIPESSNNNHIKYQIPESDYTNFKKIPSYKVHEDNEFDGFPSYKEKNPFNEKPSFLESIKNKPLFTPDTSGSYWGNSYKSSDFSPFKNQANKLQFSDITADDVVSIKPRRPNKYNYGKQSEGKLSEWSHYSRRPTKTNKPWNDWNNELTNKFKSEEDLLGLRNHDTSLPSYLPSYQSSVNYNSDEQDYKKLVDKWRQSYLKSKFKEQLRDYETFASEAKPIHVPIPKPYPIEVAHPVIVPVPQPYPVRVPVAKPVAVPFYQEITVSIEKPVPYPVYKKVPYPIEKLVPVPVEKEVAVPISKPYPVHVPYVRPVFHQTKTRDEYDSDREEDDYFPRHESKKKTQYRQQKPKYSQRDRERPVERERYTERRPSERPRRPSRTMYHDRNRRRWPDMRSRSNYEISRRPTPFKRRNIYGDVREY